MYSARATLALALLIFVPGLVEQFETPKATAVRVVGLAWLAALIMAGAAFRRLSPLDLAVVAWLPIELLATVFSQSPVLSVVGEIQQYEGLLTTFGFVGIYLAFRFGGRSFHADNRLRVAVRKSLDIILGGTAVACLYALLQVVGLDPIHWIRTAGYGPLVRPFGTLGHPNLLGVMSAASAAVALAAALQEERWRWLYALAAVLFVTTTVLTLSRGAWLGLAAGVTVVTALVWRAWRVSRLQRGFPPARARLFLGAVGALALTVLFILGSGWGESLRTRSSELLRPLGGSGRTEIWRTSVAAWWARPWLGHGPDTFELVFPRYQTPSYWRYEWTGLPFHAHSVYLHTLVTRGVGGFAVGIGWLAAFAWTARRVWRRGGRARTVVPGIVGGACAVGVAGAFGAIGIAGCLFLVTASAALAASADPGSTSTRVSMSATESRSSGEAFEPRPADEGFGSLNPSQRTKRFGWILGAIAAGASCVWCGMDLSASHAAAAARVALRSDATAADALAARAVRLRPFADSWRRLRSETLEARATAADMSDAVLHDAAAAARQAVEIEPGRNLNHYRLAKAWLALAARGDVEAPRLAAASLRRCIEISPVDAVSMLELARLELQSGDHVAALELASRAASLYPDDGPAQSLLAVVLLRDGRGDDARRALERAVAGQWHGNDLGLQTARDLLQSLP